MKRSHYCLFKTPIGDCAIAWNEPGRSSAPPAITHFQLPEATAAMTRSRIVGKSGAEETDAPPREIADVIEKVRRHLRGDAINNFLDVTLDLTGVGPLDQQVYKAARKIPPGETLSYGELAAKLKRPNAARAVGQSLGRNPVALIVPCHRILAAGGKPGGFSAHGGRATKARLLEIEGVIAARTGNSLFAAE